MSFDGRLLAGITVLAAGAVSLHDSPQGMLEMH